MKTVIVAGGTIDFPFAYAYYRQQQFGYSIAVDSGIHFFMQAGFMPQEALGDFDSADPAQLREIRQDSRVKIHQYNPQKDAVDTELALQLAIEKGSSEIHILGGTGTRLDHVLASVRLLGLAMERDILCFLVDAHNRIRLINKRTVLTKEGQYGKYVSLLPLTTKVHGVTLSGFRYPLNNYTLEGFGSIGVSNEIAGQEASIDFTDGILILAETKD